jgi:hypothetical protein
MNKESKTPAFDHYTRHNCRGAGRKPLPTGQCRVRVTITLRPEVAALLPKKPSRLIELAIVDSIDKTWWHNAILQSTAVNN